MKHPGGWYTKKNLARLWAKLRHGESMSCHPTDPRHIDGRPDEQAPEPGKTTECAGALVLQQREMHRFQGACRAAEAEGKKDGLKRYSAQHPRGLTRHGCARMYERAVFRGTNFAGVDMSLLNLNEDGIDYPPLGKWAIGRDGDG
jgi:hypothetical protein